MAQRLAPTGERFVGRAQELRQIEAAFASAAQGRGSLAVVSGEAGIGKTRFCEEIANRARGAGLTVVTARCWGDGGAPPLWPWQPILGDLCGREAADLLASDPGLTTVDSDRFARFAAVTDELAAACDRAPVCLVIDDIDAADAGTLLLTRFVARSLHHLGLVLVLSRRQGTPLVARSEVESRLLDEIESEATPVVLHQFDLGETAAFLAGHGLTDLDPELLVALLRVTGGNPLFLRRIAALGAPDPESALPGGVHVAIEQALARLSDGARRILQTSAVLGRSPSVAEAAAVAEATPAAVLDAVAEAAGAGLATAEGPDRFTFGHELVRSALEDALDAGERLDAHARAAPVVATDGPAMAPDRLARRAHHALAAASRSEADARLAVAACRTAARSMVDSFAYEQADGLLSAAVGLHRPAVLGPPPGELLVRWAQAALLCGRLGEARMRFERAVTVTEREGDPILFAEAALGLGGHWVNEHRAPVERTRVLGLQRAALARLPARHAGMRCRLAARLAAEDVYDGGPLGPVHDALAEARRCGDQAALAEALSLSHHALLAPEYTRYRLDLADELVRVASEAGHGVLALMGLCWRAVDLFELGDGRAVRALEDLRERADALACQSILYIVDVLDVMLLIRAGRLDDAERAAGFCYELGAAVGEQDALGYLSAHTLAIRWIQGRDAELLSAAEEIAASPTLVQSEFAFRATAASIAARAGHHERARAALDRLAADGLAALPVSSTWLTGMVGIVEVAAVLQDEAVARQAYDLLAPFAALPTMPSLAVACLGSTERSLGLAALTFGKADLAVNHLDRAVAANRRLQNRPLVAITRAELAGALHRRGRAADWGRAAELLARALADAELMGMTARVATWRSDLRDLVPDEAGADRRAADSRAADAAPDDDQPRPDEPRHGLIRRQGRGWVVALDGRTVHVGDLVGMQHLVELVTHPGLPIPALTLAGRGAVAAETTGHELLDPTARAAYAARARELSDDLAEADAHNDIVRAARLRAELEALVDQVEGATGLGGRPRRFTDQAERARTAVRKAIMRAIDEIGAADPGIGDTLRSSIVTGTTCIYTADPRTTIRWSTRPLGAR